MKLIIFFIVTASVLLYAYLYIGREGTALYYEISTVSNPRKIATDKDVVNMNASQDSTKLATKVANTQSTAALIPIKFASVEERNAIEPERPRINWASTDELKSKLLHLKSKAEGGDNKAARTVASYADISYSLVAQQRRQGTLPAGFEPFPDGIKNDRFYWLQLAADRGDIYAALSYAKEILQMYAHPKELVSQITVTELNEMYAKARKYLQMAADGGVADAYNYISTVYRDAKLGVTYDIAKSHACLLILYVNYPTAEVKQLVEYSASKLRQAELTQAETLARSATNCRIA